jgi:hypothetical protein
MPSAVGPAPNSRVHNVSRTKYSNGELFF